MSSEDEKKSCKRGRKPKENNPNEICRLCCVSLRVQYRNLKSCVNLFKPPKREGFDHVALSDKLTAIGISVSKSLKNSSVLCCPCARKIESLCELYKLVGTRIGSKENAEKRLALKRKSPCSQDSTPVKDGTKDGKSISPQSQRVQSPLRKSSRVRSPLSRKA